MIPTKFAILVYDWSISKNLLLLNQFAICRNHLWVVLYTMDRDEMSNIYRGPPINASYQVSVHMAKQFQSRRFLYVDQSET
jgi:hypothetical protein